MNRGAYWYLFRRVPAQFAALESRKHVSWSTGIAVWQDPRGIRAAQVVRERDAALHRYWLDKLQGKEAPSPAAFFAAQARAEELTLTYQPVAAVASLDIAELFNRFLVLANTWGTDPLANGRLTPPMQNDLKAALGGVERPVAPEEPPNQEEALLISGMVAEYERINASLLTRKSPRQRHKWRVARQANLDTFIEVIGGDRPFTSLTRKDAQAFRAHWQTRISAGDVRINSANRMVRQVSGLYSSIKDYMQIDGPGIFDKLIIPGGEDGKRLAFEPDFVQSHYLADGVFDTLNSQARRLIYLIIETGLRLSEACALDERTIILDGPVPYVDIQQHNRTTKTKESVRKIPLVGVALMAMKAQPKGFPRYYDNADSASALINKALDCRKLRPAGPGQTLYSMRHTIIDRLKAVEAPNDIQEDILGHKHMYGKGTTLEHRHRWMEKIAFKAPSKV